MPVIVIGLLLVMTQMSGFQGPQQASINSPASPEHYYAFVRYVNALSAAIASLNQRGPAGALYLERDLQRTMQCNSTCLSHLRDVASRCESKVHALNLEVARYVGDRGGMAEHPPIEVMKSFAGRREEVLLGCRAALRAKLGQAQADKIDDYIRVEIVPNLRTQPLGRGR